MFSPGEIARARQDQQNAMPDLVLVERETGTQESAYSKTTKWEEIYRGSGRVRSMNGQGKDTELAKRPVNPLQVTVSIPHNAPPVKRGDRVTVTRSVLDSGLVGLQFRVTRPHLTSYLTARRFYAEESI